MSFHPISRLERVRELRRVLVDRYGPRLPNDAAGRTLLAIAVDHALLIARDLAEKMAQQISPADMSAAEIGFMVDRARLGKMWEPQTLAKAISITEATRVRLQVRTIAATRTARERRARKGSAGRRR